MKKIVNLKIALFLLIAAANIFAQQTAYKPAAVTAQDYDRAVKMLSFSTNALVDRAGVRPTWLPDGRFWYQVLTPTGKEFILVNPADGSRTVKSNLNELGIPATASNQGRNSNEIISPDGKKAAFIRDWNLWMRDISTGKEIQLTVDGVENFGYATDNAGWTHSDRAILRWSPDSKKIATFQQDQRDVTRYVSCYNQCRCAETRKMEISASGRSDHHDPARHYRNGNSACDSSANAARRAAFDALRRHFVRRQFFATRNGAEIRQNSLSFPRRAIINRRI